MKVFLNRGYAFYDPKTNTHLTMRHPMREFSEEYMETHDMSGIRRALSSGVLGKSSSSPAREKSEEQGAENDTQQQAEYSTTIIEEPDVEEESYEPEPEPEVEEGGLELGEDEDEEEEHMCQATTKSGDPCGNRARYPENSPEYCGQHRHLLEE